MKILWVGNNQRFLSDTQKRLKNKGHDVQAISNGAEALEILRSQNIHVVILDVKKHDIRGLKVLKEIKRHFPMVQVIMLSKNGTAGCAAMSLKFGASDYLFNPITTEKLLQKVDEALERRACLEKKIRDIQIRVLEWQFKEIDFHNNDSMNQCFGRLSRL
jgi:DNA-binding NtrC family response regulator